MNTPEAVLVVLWLASRDLIERPSDYVPLTEEGRVVAEGIARQHGYDPKTLTANEAESLVALAAR